MPRRFVCHECGLKWIVREADQELTSCPACGGELAPFIGSAPPKGFTAENRSYVADER